MKNWIKLFVSAGSAGDEYWIRRLHTIALSGNGAALILLGTFMNKSDFPIEQIQASKQYFIPFIIGLFFALICAVTGVTTTKAHELKVFMYRTSKEVEAEIKKVQEKTNDTNLYVLSADNQSKIELSYLKELKETFFSEGSNMNKLHRNVFIAFTIVLISSYIFFLIGLVNIGYF